MDKKYLIVGQGLAGTVLDMVMNKSGYQTLVLNQTEEQSSSRVAAGIFNPVTGHRMNKTWLADIIFPNAQSFYSEVDKFLGTGFLQPRTVFKIFNSVEQQNDVAGRVADERYTKYVSQTVPSEQYGETVKAPFGGATFLGGGSVDVAGLMETYQQKLISENRYKETEIDYSEFQFDENGVSWRGEKYAGLICCDGWHASKNPFFSWLPFALTTGEMLEVKIPDLKEEYILNKNAFLLPLGNERFLVGASFSRETYLKETELQKKNLIEKLEDMVSLPYEIIKCRVGIRPTVRDRRPLIGKHPKIPNLFIFNGLGTKGVTLAPYFAQQFVTELDGGEKINSEANINRFFSLYSEPFA